MRFTRPSFDGRVVDRASLDFGHARRDTNHHARLRHDRETLVHFADEVVEHQLRYVEIADDPIFERPYCDNVRWGATDHTFRVGADGKGPFCLGVDGHHGWLIDDDALAAYQHQRIGGAKIDADVTGEHPHDTVERIAQRHEIQ